MHTSVDYFPDDELRLTARAQPVSGNPVRLEFTNADGKLEADFTIFTRSAPLSVRLEYAINFIMQTSDAALTRDAIETAIGESMGEALQRDRDQLYHHVRDLIGLVQLVCKTLPLDQEHDVAHNPRLTDAIAYLTQIIPPADRTHPDVARVLNADVPGVGQVDQA